MDDLLKDKPNLQRILRGQDGVNAQLYETSKNQSFAGSNNV